MTLDAQDIAAICEALLPRIKDEILAAVCPQPSKSEQIKAMTRDPELARELFRKKKKPTGRDRREVDKKEMPQGSDPGAKVETKR